MIFQNQNKGEGDVIGKDCRTGASLSPLSGDRFRVAGAGRGGERKGPREGREMKPKGRRERGRAGKNERMFWKRNLHFFTKQRIMSFDLKTSKALVRRGKNKISSQRGASGSWTME